MFGSHFYRQDCLWPFTCEAPSLLTESATLPPPDEPLSLQEEDVSEQLLQQWWMIYWTWRPSEQLRTRDQLRQTSCIVYLANLSLCLEEEAGDLQSEECDFICLFPLTPAGSDQHENTRNFCSKMHLRNFIFFPRSMFKNDGAFLHLQLKHCSAFLLQPTLCHPSTFQSIRKH